MRSDPVIRGRSGVAAVFLAVAVLAGCGSDRKAGDLEQMLSRAATAVDVANSEEARRYAPSELAAAEDRLLLARRAMRAKEYDQADRLISESLVNVNLATAKTEAARARSQLEQIKDSSPGATGQRQN